GHGELLVADLHLRLRVLHTCAGEVRLLLGDADRVVDGERRRPGGEVVGEDVAEHREEAATRLTDDRPWEPRAADELRAAEPDQSVVDAGPDVGKRLVAE